MSRGHGKWERAILEALKGAAAFYLTDLLPIPHTRSHVVALNRAARNLHDAGKIEIATSPPRVPSAMAAPLSPTETTTMTSATLSKVRPRPHPRQRRNRP